MELIDWNDPPSDGEIDTNDNGGIFMYRQATIVVTRGFDRVAYVFSVGNLFSMPESIL